MEKLPLAPLVSIIIPSKNRGKLLNRSVKSAAMQDYNNLEIIIVDDGSTPAVSELEMKSISDSCEIIVIKNELSQGGAKARNIGIAACKGEYVCFLDDDDIYLPQKISTLYNELKNNPTYDVVFGKTLLNDGKRKRFPVIYPKVFDVDLNFQLGNYIHTSATLIKRHVLAKILFNESLPKYQDTQFHLEIAQKYKILFVDSCVSEWSVDDRADQITANNTSEKKYNSYLAFIKLKNYLKYDLMVEKHHLAYFDYYCAVLKIRAKQKKKYSSLIMLIINPITLCRTIRIILTRNKYFIR
ncbi:MAG: glycosyltransferase involved in cell wall biosynthesis [Psychroserpens sp.]|jgi:glycosyltransferase involved in cell wall biosynthesis